MKDDAIVLSAADRVAGQEREVRGTWKPESKEGVRETAVVSMDGGKTWTPWFDILFRPHQALLSQGDSPNPMYSHMEAGMAADETTLRQLNDQYVEAFMKADKMVPRTPQGRFRLHRIGWFGSGQEGVSYLLALQDVKLPG